MGVDDNGTIVPRVHDHEKMLEVLAPQLPGVRQGLPQHEVLRNECAGDCERLLDGRDVGVAVEVGDVGIDAGRVERVLRARKSVGPRRPQDHCARNAVEDQRGIVHPVPADVRLPVRFVLEVGHRLVVELDLLDHLPRAVVGVVGWPEQLGRLSHNR